jgi:molecular chaperone GrpE
MSEQSPSAEAPFAGAEPGASEATDFDSLKAHALLLEREIQLLKEQELRTRAELDNVRKRAERDTKQQIRFSNERLLGDLLGAIDSLELGLKAAEKPEATAQSIGEGMALTLRQLNGILERHGVSVIDPQGQPFNPELHEAVSSLESTQIPPNHVSNVMQKGYRLHERLLRPAMVIVAKAPAAPTS